MSTQVESMQLPRIGYFRQASGAELATRLSPRSAIESVPVASFKRLVTDFPSKQLHCPVCHNRAVAGVSGVVSPVEHGRWVAQGDQTLVFPYNFPKVNGYSSSIFHIYKIPWVVRTFIEIERPPNGARRRKVVTAVLSCETETANPKWRCDAMVTFTLSSEATNSSEIVDIKTSFDKNHRTCSAKAIGEWTPLQRKSPPDDDSSEHEDESGVSLKVQIRLTLVQDMEWQSRKETGCVGLLNMGATCYMSTMLQTLFFIPAFRQVIYRLPAEYDDPQTSVGLGILKLFYHLENDYEPVDPRVLASTFRWNADDASVQQDIQEFWSLLLEKLIDRTSGTTLDGALHDLFEGELVTTVVRQSQGTRMERIETFRDLVLPVYRMGTLEAALDSYTGRTEDTNIFSRAPGDPLPDQFRAVAFRTLPPIISIVLNRIVYSTVNMDFRKLDDRIEFPKVLSLAKYTEAAVRQALGDKNAQIDEARATYRLFAVVSHAGNAQGGHYTVFIDRFVDSNWLRFDDDIVTYVSEKDAIQGNYGPGSVKPPEASKKPISEDDGNDADESSSSDSDIVVEPDSTGKPSAYMLVYLHERVLPSRDITVTVPQDVAEFLKEDDELSKQLKRKREDTITLRLYRDEHLFVGNQTPGHYDPISRRYSPLYTVKRKMPFGDVEKMVMTSMGYNDFQARLWIVRMNEGYLRFKIPPDDEAIDESLPKGHKTLQGWLQIASEETFLFYPRQQLSHMFAPVRLVFFKQYHPRASVISFHGSICSYIHLTAEELADHCRKLMKWDPLVKMKLFQEWPSNGKTLRLMEPISDRVYLQPLISQRGFGEIVVFEKLEDPSEVVSYMFPSVMDYYTDLPRRIKVSAMERYGRIALTRMRLPPGLGMKPVLEFLGKRLAVHPAYIRLYLPGTSKGNYKHNPGMPIAKDDNGVAADWFKGTNPINYAPFVYELLPFPMEEMHGRVPIEMQFVDLDYFKERQLLVYITPEQTFQEVLKEVPAYPEVEYSAGGSRQFRVVEVREVHLIYGIPDPALKVLDTVLKNPDSIFRIEELHLDEMTEEAADGVLIPCHHRHPTTGRAYGIPFYIKFPRDWTLAGIKNRIRHILKAEEQHMELKVTLRVMQKDKTIGILTEQFQEQHSVEELRKIEGIRLELLHSSVPRKRGSVRLSRPETIGLLLRA